ncbi:MAG: NAD(P)H-hydrate dehydratase [Parcubacteria group bacterium]|nr:NAD(P)H-hydrate dehydratase [Parcubacteria group bacterium]
MKPITQNKIIFPEILAPRPGSVHKKQCGQVLVVAGSRGMTGAAVLTCRAALRAGAGIVTLAFPETLTEIYADLLPEVMTIPCPATDEGTLSYEALEILIEKSAEFDVVAIGPGLSQNKETQKLIRELIVELDKPLVLDADGLNALAGQVDKLLPQRKNETIITPHEGEMARLSGLSVENIKEDRAKIAQNYVQKWLVNILLKGPETIIAGPDGRTVINESGSRALATAGTGDVLTGILATLWAQNIKQPLESASTAVYLHGLAGDKAAAKLGKRSVIASDVIGELPKLLKMITED